MPPAKNHTKKERSRVSLTTAKDPRGIYARAWLAKNPKEIFKEYKTKEMAKIKPDNYTYLVWQQFESKNRYRDIMCLDNTRVKLKDRDSSNDYIHASWMTMANGRRYISTQGPMEDTIGDFWHMIITEQSTQIVMLCALNEGKKSKCERYYPKFSKGDSIKAGDYKITYDQKLHSIHKEMSIYQYKVTGGKLTEPFIVTHFLVNSWKDHSIPTNLEQIIALLKRVTKAPLDKPITVHSSAGIGRTASFVAVDYANQAIMANPDFTMSQLLKELRKMRFHAVQGGGQYLYIHAGLIELWVTEGIIKRDHCESFLAGYKKISEILDKKVDESA